MQQIRSRWNGEIGSGQKIYFVLFWWELSRDCPIHERENYLSQLLIFIYIFLKYEEREEKSEIIQIVIIVLSFFVSAFHFSWLFYIELI